jgi:tetratricopeptide (TPR) repeat protein
MTPDLTLPDPPASLAHAPVKAWREPVSIPTYEPLKPDRLPMFLDQRVYQGSSGRVYPLPCYSRISQTRTLRSWDAVHIENEHLRVMILPELGGRIHVLRDRRTGYDLIYCQNVIKPALVGLAGPWVSGGIEFNWPQHHRPATFMPVCVEVEACADRSVVVWLGDHDPMQRMLGVHGVKLSPGVAAMDVLVRLHNRTQLTQTFLWWANVATRVHERYQSFFPRDVSFVADHARRAMSAFPLCKDRYYGVDYASRARQGVAAHEAPARFKPTGEYAANDLSWFANIPVPTSYMCIGSKQDFHGGYDHAAGMGIVHVASHHISPGKKQWTWGNHDFGYAWDRQLTDADERGVHQPYIELMAGVFTDNQPDFSFLAPGETRCFTQRWYPIRGIGPATSASQRVAASLVMRKRVACVGIGVTEPIAGARVVLSPLGEKQVDLRPDEPFFWELPLPPSVGVQQLELRIADATGELLLRDAVPGAGLPTELPPSASEPPVPSQIAGQDELYLTGVHLEQYRHATRSPEPYWREALRRDPLDSRCNTAMGNWYLRRGEFESARSHFERAIDRLIARNANPRDGESYYGLGLTYRWLGLVEEAYAALYKATWNWAWQVPAFVRLAEIDASRGRWDDAYAHATAAMERDVRNSGARNIAAMSLRARGLPEQAEQLLRESVELQPHDFWALDQLGRWSGFDAATHIDIAWDYARCGQYRRAMEVIERARPSGIDGTKPLLAYHHAWFASESDAKPSTVRAMLRRASAAPVDYCFPSRLEDQHVLAFALKAEPRDARAAYYLGNLLYDRGRQDEAIELWRRALRGEPTLAQLWRNLGIASLNVRRSPAEARRCFRRAVKADPQDARLLYEQDQLEHRLGANPAARMARLRKHRPLVGQRDDLSVAYATLLNQCGRPAEALDLLLARRFQPWEGGEGLVLAQFVRSHLLLGRVALREQKPEIAKSHFHAALNPPESLGETFHLLANRSDIFHHLGLACAAAGQRVAAREAFKRASLSQGDFQQMSVKSFSELTYFSALSARALGQRRRERQLLQGLLGYARDLARSKATIDYFATSLPTMLLFNDDLQQRQSNHARLLEGLALLGLNRRQAGVAKLRAVLKADPSHGLAADILAEVNP